MSNSRQSGRWCVADVGKVVIAVAVAIAILVIATEIASFVRHADAIALTTPHGTLVAQKGVRA